MTTAHRSTFYSIRALEDAGGYKHVAPSNKQHARSVPSHTKLKERIFESDDEDLSDLNIEKE